MIVMNKGVIIGAILVVVVIFTAGIAYFVLVPKNTVQKPVTPVPLTIPTQPKKTEVTEVPAVNQIKLVVLTPKDKAIVKTSSVKVTGQTVPNADVAINELNIKSDAKGNFSANLTLSEGDNPIVVSAFDADGNTSEQEITIIYEP